MEHLYLCDVTTLFRCLELGVCQGLKVLKLPRCVGCFQTLYGYDDGFLHLVESGALDNLHTLYTSHNDHYFSGAVSLLRNRGVDVKSSY